jgi:hypothetical protein
MSANLSYITKSAPQPGTDGHFSPWVIEWRLPDGTLPAGFLIQYLEYSISATYCDGDDLSQEEIWNQWYYMNANDPDQPRFNFWETWVSGDGLTDSWCEPSGRFFSTGLKSGKIVITGTAAWYDIPSLDSAANGWGRNGQNLGSPMSGDLLSTTGPASLPDIATVTRSMTVIWDPCSNSGQQGNTTVDFGPPGGQ